MDLIADYFNPNKTVVPIRIPVGRTNGALNIEHDRIDDIVDDFDKDYTTDYAEEYQKREAALYAKSFQAKEENSFLTVENTDDIIPPLLLDEVLALKEERATEVYSKYGFNYSKTNELVIDSYRDKIISLVEAYDVVIIQGPTGCGKTTQVPQFMLDQCREQNRPCNIIVTQPRRIAALSVAKRVCEERGWPLGSICGYQVGLESNKSVDTILTYVTTGVLLQKLIAQKSLHGFTHIIVDEVHERNQDMDFLLLVVRKFLYTNSINVKVILMSATFDTGEFAHYFRNHIRTGVTAAPIIYISKESKFNTQTYYAEQLTLFSKIPSYKVEEPKIDVCLYAVFVRLMRTFDRLDPLDSITNQTTIGNVLVFLPGIVEIEDAYKHLKEFENQVLYEGQSLDIKWQILPLHSSITTEEQRKVFLPAEDGKRKIILSTNIAESSITVPDVLYVVDFCLTKTMVVDCNTQFQSLELQWASYVNCTQRAGRVGRVADGRVYRLVTREFYERKMTKTIEPEILRAPLDRLILASKMLDLGEEPKAILALALNPPNLANIESTILSLKEVGALLTTVNKQNCKSDGDLTFMGKVMASLPIDVRLSKLIILGHMFSCLQDTIIMAAGCSLNNIFSSPFQERLKAYTNKLQWADGSYSDMIAYLNLYKVWERNKSSNSFRTGAGENNWVRKNYLSWRALKEWQILITEIKERLKRMGIVETVGPSRVRLGHQEVPFVLKVVIGGAFYPNYFKRSSDGGQVDEREAVKTLGGRDPCSTVYFHNFDPYQPGALYAKRIKELLINCGSNMQVTFDNSSKIYVQFLNHNQTESVMVDGQEYVAIMPGKVKVEVYRSVRRRQLRMPNKIHVLSSASEAWARAKSLGITEKKIATSERSENEPEQPEQRPSLLPTLDVEFIRIRVSEMIDAGHFWAHYVESETDEILFSLEKALNSRKLDAVNKTEVETGDIYAAKFAEDKKYYRCKVLSIKPFGSERNLIAQVIFIDYGNTQSVPVSSLCILPDTEILLRPAHAMECMLSEIQPSIVLNPRAIWSNEANAQFDQKTRDITLYGKVYSVVNGVVHLELYRTENHNSGKNMSLNSWLIEKGYGQPAEESFLSKENHMKRIQVRTAENLQQEFLKFDDEDSWCSSIRDVEPPPIDECTREIELKGPYSPLEMQVYSMVASGTYKQVRIEGSSVNSVLLDYDPQDPHERMIVSAIIGQSPHNTNLTLRHTTMMPNIHGLPMLMCLIFCPVMEPKPTADGSRIAAILCGLGMYDHSRKSVYPQHDVALTLDTELTQLDLNKINELRFWLNSTLSSMEAIASSNSPVYEIDVCQREVKTRLFDLLKTKRASVEREFVRFADVWGKSEHNSAILQPDNMMPYDIWPLHWTIKLNEEAQSQQKMQDHITNMENMATRTVNMQEIICQLCNVTLHSVPDMRVHLISNAHRQKELQYKNV